MKQPVILIHGLARTARSMSRLNKALESDGFPVYSCDYPSRKQSIDTLVNNYLAPLIANVSSKHSTESIHFVTHSMGGILLRFYAQKNSAIIANSVMIGPPNGGSELVDRLGALFLFKWINGPAGLELGTSAQSLPGQIGAANFPVGIIAGNHNINPLWSALIPGPNDGKVSINSAKLQGMKDFIELPVNHTFMMDQASVIDQTKRFLNSGNFKHPN